jgi:hypothetical protein
MRTVFLEWYFGGDLSQPRPAPDELVHAVIYVSCGDILVQRVIYVHFHI